MPTGSGDASTKLQRSRACSVSSWTTPTRRGSAARRSRTTRPCGADWRRSPRTSRRYASSSIAPAVSSVTARPSPTRPRWRRCTRTRPGRSWRAWAWTCSGSGGRCARARGGRSSADRSRTSIRRPSATRSRAAPPRSSAPRSPCAASASRRSPGPPWSRRRAEMDFRLSPAQQILTTTARAFLRQHCPPELVQRLALDERGFDEALWRRMAELGWPGLMIPSDLGGSDGTLLDVILLVDAISGEKLFEVTFDRVEVRPDDLLGRVGDGAALLPPALRAGALARTAEMVGGAQRVLELVVEHAKTRVQGGRPIGGYQAIQHACADLVRDVDAARALLYAAAWKDAEGRAAEADAALAKAYAADACLAVARRGHQIFGAISYCEEHPLHLLHKRIQAASLDFGDAQLHLETVARAIGLEGRL